MSAVLNEPGEPGGFLQLNPDRALTTFAGKSYNFLCDFGQRQFNFDPAHFVCW